MEGIFVVPVMRVSQKGDTCGLVFVVYTGYPVQSGGLFQKRPKELSRGKGNTSSLDEATRVTDASRAPLLHSPFICKTRLSQSPSHVFPRTLD